MNPELPSNPREELELRITSLLLGELSEAEASLVRDAIANDPELQKLHDDLKQTIHLVREATVSAGEMAHEESEPLKLSVEGRKKLFTAFVIPPLKPEHIQPKRERKWFVPAAAMAAITAVIIGMWLLSGARRERGAVHTAVDMTDSRRIAKILSADSSPNKRPGEGDGQIQASGQLEGLGMMNYSSASAGLHDSSITLGSGFGDNHIVAATNGAASTWSRSASVRAYYPDNPTAAPTPSAPAQYSFNPLTKLPPEPKLAPPPTEIVLPKSGDRDGDALQVADNNGVRASNDFFASEGRGGGGVGGTFGPDGSAPTGNKSGVTLGTGEVETVAGGKAVGESFTDRLAKAKNLAAAANGVEFATGSNPTPDQNDKGERFADVSGRSGNSDAEASKPTGISERNVFALKAPPDPASLIPAEPDVASKESDGQKGPLIGDVPLVGRLFRSEINSQPEQVTIDGKKYEKEFVGYDDPGGFVPLAQSLSSGTSAGFPLTAQLPVPHYRLKQVEAASAPATTLPASQSDFGRYKSDNVTPGQDVANLYYVARKPAFIGAPTTAGDGTTAQGAATAAVQNGRLLFESGKYDEAEAALNQALKADPGNVAAAYYSSVIRERRDANASVSRAIQSKDRILQVENAWAIPFSREQLPVAQPSTNFVVGDSEWVGTLERPDRPHTSSNQYVSRYAYVASPGQALDIASVHEQAKQPSIDRFEKKVESAKPQLTDSSDLASVEGKRNIDEALSRYAELSGKTVLRPSTLPETQIPLESKAGPAKPGEVQTLNQELGAYGIVMVPVGSNYVKAVPVSEASAAGGKIESGDEPSLYTRTFKVDPDSFRAGVQNAPGISLSGGGGGQDSTIPRVSVSGGGERAGGGGQSVPGIQQSARDLFKSVGADLNTPGKSVFFNERQGTLFVRGTLQDLDVIDQTVKVLNIVPPQVNIAAKFAEIAARTNLIDAPLPRKPATNAPIPQPEIQTSENNFSTFSLNVSDVSFKLAAASLEKGQMPDSASIRSEEFINAFDYRDSEPTAGSPVAFAWERARYPFAHNRDLLRFSLKTAAAGRQAGRPLNIVLLLDNSGSMERADRVGIIREALRVLASQLQPQDKLSVITFARTPRLVADGVAGDKAGEVTEQVSGLMPEGGTNLEDAMNLAYQTAAKHFLANGINRVVLLTDGAANLGDVEPGLLKQKVETQRQQGIALDCFGIGWEGFNDDLLETLSRNGDGRYGFINSPEEAATEFAGQLAGALKVAASDVKVQVEFNPKRVTSYRQIGYAKHQLTKEQFRDNTVDAAEIAAQEAGNALYTVEVNPAGEGPLATVRVRYKIPGTSDYREQAWEVPFNGNSVAIEQASPAMRLATSASAFSEWLAVSPHAGEVRPDALLNILSGVPEAFGADSRPKKLEWMIRQAKSLEGK